MKNVRCLSRFFEIKGSFICCKWEAFAVKRGSSLLWLSPTVACVMVQWEGCGSDHSNTHRSFLCQWTGTSCHEDHILASNQFVQAYWSWPSASFPGNKAFSLLRAGLSSNEHSAAPSKAAFHPLFCHLSVGNFSNISKDSLLHLLWHSCDSEIRWCHGLFFPSHLWPAGPNEAGLQSQPTNTAEK